MIKSFFTDAYKDGVIIKKRIRRGKLKGLSEILFHI